MGDESSGIGSQLPASGLFNWSTMDRDNGKVRRVSLWRRYTDEVTLSSLSTITHLPHGIRCHSLVIVFIPNLIPHLSNK